MADSILSSVLSKQSFSLKSDKTGQDAAENLKVIAVNFHYRARPMRHMREDGTSIVDSKVVDPALVEIDAICPTLDSINKINTALMDRTSTYTVTSKGIQLRDVSNEHFELRQTPDMLSASPIRITLKQLLRQGGVASGVVVEQPADSSMFSRGIQSVAAVTTPVDNAFSRVIGTSLPPLQ
jgi:hypothetical protein